MFLENEPKKTVNLVDTTEFGHLNTPLHYSCIQGNMVIIKELLDKGANINMRNKFGLTPIFYAAQSGHLDVCELLLKSGADPTISGSHDNYPQSIFSPVDHIQDQPALKKIFESHPSCKIPKMLMIDSISITLSSIGCIKLNLESSCNSISKLPIINWIIHIYSDKEKKDILLKKYIKSINFNPNESSKNDKDENQTFKTELEQKEFQNISDLYKNKDPIYFIISGENAIGEGPFSDLGIVGFEK
jgi:hypothetical protein